MPPKIARLAGLGAFGACAGFLALYAYVVVHQPPHADRRHDAGAVRRSRGSRRARRARAHRRARRHRQAVAALSPRRRPARVTVAARSGDGAPPAVQPSTVATKFGRALLLRCPRCGGRGILRSWFKMRDECPHCGLMLERGESSDFWIGAYVFNLVGRRARSRSASRSCGSIATWPNPPWTRSRSSRRCSPLACPLLFFPFSRTLWLAWDLSFRPFEPGDVAGGPNP